MTANRRHWTTVSQSETRLLSSSHAVLIHALARMQLTITPQTRSSPERRIARCASRAPRTPAAAAPLAAAAPAPLSSPSITTAPSSTSPRRRSRAACCAPCAPSASPSTRRTTTDLTCEQPPRPLGACVQLRSDERLTRAVLARSSAQVRAVLDCHDVDIRPWRHWKSCRLHGAARCSLAQLHCLPAVRDEGRMDGAGVRWCPPLPRGLHQGDLRCNALLLVHLDRAHRGLLLDGTHRTHEVRERAGMHAFVRGWMRAAAGAFIE